MNVQLKQRIDEKLERLSEQRVAEVLDFVEFLEGRERATASAHSTPMKTPSADLLSPPFLDTRGFKFDRDEANER